MKAHEIISQVKNLKLPEGEYIVFGSCPMALAGIRESSDIDMLVSKRLFEQLENNGWQLLDKGGNDKPLTFGDFEAHYSWNFSSYQPTLEQLLSTATIADGVPFAALDEVRKWKVSSGRPKDLTDIQRIDEYLARQKD